MAFLTRGVRAALVALWCSAPALAQAPAQPSPADSPAVIAFPGQYAPKPRNERFAVWPQSCRKFADSVERSACYEHVVFDFPRLSRFADANAALAAPRPGENRVVFFGDSITDNWSKEAFGGFFPGKPYVNRGIGGQTTGQMLLRMRADVINLRPKVVVILAGTNDVAGNSGPARPESIEDNLTSMAELARANRIKVVLASILPVADDKKDAAGKPVVRTRDRAPATVQAINRWMADYARKNHDVFLDYAAALADGRGLFKPELNYDGLHPNKAGYGVMAPLAEKAIAAALRR
jgi:lysophospholipase L1-like esterase